MGYSFLAWFRIEHEYCGGICRCVQLEASAETLKLLKRNKLLLHIFDGELSVLGMENALDEPLRLTFFGYIKDPEVYMATEFGVDAGAFPVFSRELRGVKNFPLPDSALKPAFGIEVEVSNTHRVEEPQVLLLRTRRVRWRYFLLDSLARSDLDVVDTRHGSKAVVFECEPAEALHAFVYTSDKEIPLQLHSDHRFQLREKGSAKVLFKCLPNMGVRSLAMATFADGNRSVVAESYIIP
ncbi:MAG: hypothetical protein M0P13_06295 [Fibrobacteraceae bacterium]|nr:hypothetical protein [Fibrobacteraceae bacterium]